MTLHRPHDRNGDKPECAICLEDLYDGKKLSAWRLCGHVFHLECSLLTIQNGREDSHFRPCPLCRKDAWFPDDDHTADLVVLYLPEPPSYDEDTIARMNDDLTERASQLDRREAELEEREARLKVEEDKLNQRESALGEVQNRNPEPVDQPIVISSDSDTADDKGDDNDGDDNDDGDDDDDEDVLPPHTRPRTRLYIQRLRSQARKSKDNERKRRKTEQRV